MHFPQKSTAPSALQYTASKPFWLNNNPTHSTGTLQQLPALCSTQAEIIPEAPPHPTPSAPTIHLQHSSLPMPPNIYVGKPTQACLNSLRGHLFTLTFTPVTLQSISWKKVLGKAFFFKCTFFCYPGVLCLRVSLSTLGGSLPT